jgi:predicted DNA binding CopG/RHH family protein
MQNTKEKSVTVTRSESLPSKVHAEISKRASKAGMGLSTYIRMIIIRALENGNG